MIELLLINEHSPRADIEAAIAALRTKQRRLPVHFTEDRERIAQALEELGDWWLAAGPDA